MTKTDMEALAIRLRAAADTVQLVMEDLGHSSVVSPLALVRDMLSREADDLDGEGQDEKEATK